MTGIRLCFFGSYDRYRPRNSVLLKGLRARGIAVDECWYSPWVGVRDKSQLGGARGYVSVCLRYLVALPALLVRYLLSTPRHDAIVVPYLGQVDVILAKIAALLTRKPVVFVPHVSLHETVVEDRRLVKERGLLSLFLHRLDALSLRVPDLVVVDTADALEHYRDQLGLRPEKAVVVPVGAQDDLFTPRPARSRNDGTLRVLFYGTFIPLQGVETILRAAREVSRDPIAFRLIGRGQEYPKASAWASREELRNVEWVPWVDYERLPQAIAEADVCLGIFGKTPKAGRVIPNKVFQALAMGKPVVTGDYPVVRRYLRDRHDCMLVSPGDGVQLADVLRLLAQRSDFRRRLGQHGRETYLACFSTKAVTDALVGGLRDRLGIGR